MGNFKTCQCLFFLIMLLSSGCRQGPDVLNKGMNQHEAIDAALKIASMPQPEISGSQVTPSNVHAEQMTLAEAVKRIQEDNSVATGYDLEMLVWLVTMDGIWLDEFPVPTGMTTPEAYHHFSIIIDQKTGVEIESSGHP